jgi:hypothetical protein
LLCRAEPNRGLPCHAAPRDARVQIPIRRPRECPPANPSPAFAIAERVRVMVDLPEVDAALLRATMQHTGKTEAEVIGEALRCLFVHYPRPEDGGRP